MSLATGIVLTPRRRGRPTGSVDRHGRAKRCGLLYAEQVVRTRVAAAIRSSREESDVSAEELAAAIGVSKLTVFAWEAGRVAPRVSRLIQIARALGIPPDHLLANA